MLVLPPWTRIEGAESALSAVERTWQDGAVRAPSGVESVLISRIRACASQEGTRMIIMQPTLGPATGIVSAQGSHGNESALSTSDGTVRLEMLDPLLGGSPTLDGAWWPRSRSLTEQLPPLIVELHRRGIRITRVAYRRETWDAAPRRLPADNRVIRLGWFQSLDPHLVSLTGGQGGQTRLDLLVVPPWASELIARRAMADASGPDNHRAASAVLSSLSVLPTVLATEAPMPPRQ